MQSNPPAEISRPVSSGSGRWAVREHDTPVPADEKDRDNRPGRPSIRRTGFPQGLEKVTSMLHAGQIGTVRGPRGGCLALRKGNVRAGPCARETLSAGPCARRTSARAGTRCERLRDTAAPTPQVRCPFHVGHRTCGGGSGPGGAAEGPRRIRTWKRSVYAVRTWVGCLRTGGLPYWGPSVRDGDTAETPERSARLRGGAARPRRAGTPSPRCSRWWRGSA